MLVVDLQNSYRVSHRRASRVVLAARSTLAYIPVEKQDHVIRQRIIEIAQTRVRYGFWRIHVLLKREGWKINHKRTYRIYKEEGLNLRSKRPRRSRSAAHRLERPGLTGIYQCCSMDFMAD